MKKLRFQSTPPARGATDYVPRDMTVKVHISIHAPREGGDVKKALREMGQNPISIHAPREGGDSKDAQFYL